MRGTGLMMVAVGLGGCWVDSGEWRRASPDTDTGEESAGLELPEPVDDARGVPTISGRVRDPARLQLDLVEVSACGVTTTPDDQGWFRLSDAALAGCATVEAGRPGQVPTSRPLHFRANQHASTKLTLPPPATLLTLPSDAPITVRGTDGVAFSFPGGGFRTEAGEPYEGGVTLAYVFLDDVLQMPSAPGGLATASGPLQSHGMVGVELYGPDLAPLTFEGTAEVRFPLAKGAPFEAGDEAPLYHWEDGEAAWTLAGTGKVGVDGTFIAQVDGFSWWNCDQPAETRGCVTGRLSVGLEGADVQGAEIVGRSHDLNVVQTTFTREDGSFCLDLPEGPATLGAVHVRDDVAWAWRVDDVYVPGSGGTCGREACAVDLGTLQPTSRRSVCVTGHVDKPGCILFDRFRGERWMQPHRVTLDEAGSFRATIPLPTGLDLHLHERRLEAPDHGASAVKPAGFGSCIELGEVVPHDKPERDTGGSDTGYGSPCW